MSDNNRFLQESDVMQIIMRYCSDKMEMAYCHSMCLEILDALNLLEGATPMTNNNQAAEREAFECRVYALAEKERYEYLPSLFKRNHLSTEDYATTWVDMMWKGWQARAALAQPASSIPIPTTEAEAELMQKLGYAWLKEHAPHRLVQPASSEEPVAWAHPDGRVIPAKTKSTALRDGGASASSVAGYTIPLDPIAAQGDVVLVPRALVETIIDTAEDGFIDYQIIAQLRARLGGEDV